MSAVLLRPVMTVALALILSSAAAAQQTVMVGEIEATRIVIPPAQSELARTIKAGLRGAYYGAAPESAAWREAQRLYFLYAERRFEPFWLVETPAGVDYSEAARRIIAVFEDARAQGLRPEDYLTDAVRLHPADTDPARLAEVETAFSASVTLYARHASGGRIDPSVVSRSMTLRPRQIDTAELMSRLAEADDPAALLMDLHPKHREFVALREQLQRVYDGAVEEQVIIPDGRLMKAGRTDERVPLLRQRLDLVDPADNPLAYDDGVREAVKAFQEQFGLVVDGVVGPATIAALNGTHGASAEDIIANMERWRWLPEDLSDFYVFVNVPEYRLEIHDADRITFNTRVVVGQRTHQTPIFYDEIEHVVVNPYWNVPASIARNEIAPILASNPGYLASHNMELLHGGRIVNASAVNWSRTSVNEFRIRQRPGPGNALGNIKFLFPNQHNVYLHDTPSKSLFSRSARAFSHGCIRVQNPMDFADALLVQEPDLDSARLTSMFGRSERWVNVERHIPVYINYFTLRVGEDGTIRSYPDVYGHNERMVNLLSG